jgi:nucleotide-binding universal stress UspA family protein
MGTPAYISPEQVLGNRNNPSSDIFALGCILYELATGTKPFGEPTTTAGMKRRIYHSPQSPRELQRSVPRSLAAVIMRCLEVDPLRRYVMAGNVAFDLANPEQVAVQSEARGGGGVLGRIRGLFSPKKAVDLTSSTRNVGGEGRAVVLVAVDLADGSDALAEQVRLEAQRVLAASPGARLACLTVLKTELLGAEADLDALGRSAYVNRLVALKDWAQPIGLPDDIVSYHVVEAFSPAGAILQYAKHNDVGHIVLGARASSALRRHLGSVSAEVVAEALCSVSVARVKRIEERARDAA